MRWKLDLWHGTDGVSQSAQTDLERCSISLETANLGMGMHRKACGYILLYYFWILAANISILKLPIRYSRLLGLGWTLLASAVQVLLFHDYLGMSENGVYPQWNSHLVRIMISKTIGSLATQHFQTNPSEILPTTHRKRTPKWLRSLYCDRRSAALLPAGNHRVRPWCEKWCPVLFLKTTFISIF